METYPKRLQVNDPKWSEFFDAVYVHERERLGMEPDLFLPECPICVRKRNLQR